MIDRVLRWAAESGYSKSEFAREMGISPQRLNNWRTRGMPARECLKAARILGRTLDEIYGIVPEKPGGRPAASDVKSAWPFAFARERYEKLGPEKKAAIETAVLSLVEAFEAGRAPPRKRSAA